MATTIGTAWINIKPSLSGVQSSIQKQLKGTGSAVGDDFTNEMKSSVAKGTAIGTALGNILYDGAKKALAAIGELFQNAVTQSSSLRSASKTLQAMGYSSDEVAKSIERLNNHLRSFPTYTSDALSGVKQLAASWGDLDFSTDAFMAFNDAILMGGGTTDNLNNAITQLSQVALDGPLDAQTWLSLRNSGLLPAASAVASLNGMTVNELKESLGQGEMTTRDFMNALIDLDKNGTESTASFYDKAVAGVDNIDTALEVAKKSIVQSFQEILDSIDIQRFAQPIAQAGVSIGAGIKDVFDKAKNAFTALAEDPKIISFVESLKSAFDGLMSVIRPIAEGLATLIGDKFEAIGSALATIARNEKVQAALGKIGDILRDIGAVVSWVMEKLGALWEFVKPYVAPVTDFLTNVVFSGINLVLDAIIGLFNFIKSIPGIIENVVNFFKSAFETVKTGANTVGEFFKGVFNAVARVVKPILDGIAKTFSTVFNVIKTIVYVHIGLIAMIIKWLVEQIKPYIEEIGQFFSEVFEKIKTVVEPVIESVKEGIARFVEFTKETIGTIVAWFQERIEEVKAFFRAVRDTVQMVLDEIASFFKSTFEAIKQFCQPAIDFIANAITTLKETTRAVLEGIKNFFVEAWENIKAAWNAAVTWFKDLFEKVVNTIKEKFTPIVEWFKARWEDIKRVFSEAYNTGKEIVEGLWNGINDMVGWIKSKIQGFGDSVLQALKDFFGIQSPSKVMRDEVGKFISMGLADGILKGEDAVTSAMNQLGNDALAQMTGIDSELSKGISTSVAANAMLTSDEDSARVVQNNVFNVNDNFDLLRISSDLGYAVAMA